jgi:hypothetical protein
VPGVPGGEQASAETGNAACCEIIMNQSKQPAAGDTSTPGRPHDTSRQQKHDDQHLDSGSRSLDKQSSGDQKQKDPKPPGPK